MKYMTHPYQRPAPEADLIWEEGTTQVWDYAPTSSGPLVILIPSLVNRGYILDLCPHLSLIHSLRQQGLRPWLVEWQALGSQETSFGLEDYIKKRLLPLFSYASEKHQAPFSVVGYCMGGNLALGALSLLPPDIFKNLALLGTPWDFHLPLGPEVAEFMSCTLDFSQNFPNPFLAWEPFMDFWKNHSETFPTSSLTLPSHLIQLYFHQMVSPHSNVQKFFMIADLELHSQKMEDFVALEEWINDGVPLSGPIAWDCFYGWGVENRLARGLWFLGEKAVTLDQIAVPTLVITAQKDQIVPPLSSAPLSQSIPQVHSLSVEAGHVGMIIGRRAPQEVWHPLGQWLKQGHEEKVSSVA
jgi:polyhydroxyalkanoate synthase